MYGMDGDKYYEETKELLKDFSSRTMKLISECDVAVFLPGGDCTIQEIATFNQYNREHKNSHKIILVNINGIAYINIFFNIAPFVKSISRFERLKVAVIIHLPTKPFTIFSLLFTLL